MRETSAMDFRIDYEHIDVADIMAQVKRGPPRGRPRPSRARRPTDGGPDGIGSPSGRGLRSAPAGLRRAARRSSQEGPSASARPFLRLPCLYMAVARSSSHQRLDGHRRFDGPGIASARRPGGLRRQDRATARPPERVKDLDDEREYIKLLHNLSHNLVVELTKLKIEIGHPEEQGPDPGEGLRVPEQRGSGPSRRGPRMKLAFVVQRYGLEINGGAELHCRWIAEHMSQALPTSRC